MESAARLPDFDRRQDRDAPAPLGLARSAPPGQPRPDPGLRAGCGPLGFRLAPSANRPARPSTGGSPSRVGALRKSGPVVGGKVAVYKAWSGTGQGRGGALMAASAQALPIIEILPRLALRGYCPQFHLLPDIRFHSVCMGLNGMPDAARPERIGMARDPNDQQGHSHPKPERPEQSEIGQGSNVFHTPHIGTKPAFVKCPARLPPPGVSILIRADIPGGCQLFAMGSTINWLRGHTAARPVPTRKASSCFS